MADTIEFSSQPVGHYAMYKITGNGFCFDVKTQNCAAIGLSKEADTECDYWILLHNQSGYSWIRKKSQVGHLVKLPNIVTQKEYRGFWLCWYGGILKIGCVGMTRALLTYPCNEQLDYATFGVGHQGSPVDWRIDLPLLLHKPILKGLKTGQPRWVPVEEGSKLPADCVLGGKLEELIYVIRIKYEDCLYPGMYIPSENCGVIGWPYESFRSGQVEALCGYNYKWVASSAANIPTAAVCGGHTAGRRERLYVARARFREHLLPGYVLPSEEVCYVVFEGYSHREERYEILVALDDDTSRVEGVTVQPTNDQPPPL